MLKILNINEWVAESAIATVTNTTGMGNVKLPSVPANQYDFYDQIEGSGDIPNSIIFRAKRKKKKMKIQESASSDVTLKIYGKNHKLHGSIIIYFVSEKARQIGKYITKKLGKEINTSSTGDIMIAAPKTHLEKIESMLSRMKLSYEKLISN